MSNYRSLDFCPYIILFYRSCVIGIVIFSYLYYFYSI
nr:MAG TPA: hypothetical protein [Caudoviricetes sp.]